MKVKTNFKQMYLVDNILYNKLNQHSTKPYLISSNVSQPPPTITFQPPPTFHPPPTFQPTFQPPPTFQPHTSIKDNVLQDSPQSFETKFEPSLNMQDNALLKTTAEAQVPNKDILPSVPEGINNVKPFELEANRFLDDISQGKYVQYKSYTHEQPAQQPTALEFNEPNQLAVSKHDSSKQLLSKSTPAIQTNASQQVRPLALPQPMEYQQSLPVLKQNEVMQVDDECKECENILSDPPTYSALPPPQTYHALPPPTSYPLLPSTYSSITPSNSELALLTPRPTLPSTNPALPPPTTNPALSAPPTYPLIQSSFTYPAQSSPSNSKLALPPPQLALPPTNPALPAPPTYPVVQSSFTYPAQSSPSNSKLALPTPQPTLTIPALPPPTDLALPSPVKYEVYTKSKQIPTMMSYICTRCNTSFMKESSLINHNKRFHHAFNQSVKGVKRLSKDEITHGEKKISKIVPTKRKQIQTSTKRKQIQNLNKQMLTYEPYP